MSLKFFTVATFIAGAFILVIMTYAESHGYVQTQKLAENVLGGLGMIYGISLVWRAIINPFDD